MYWNNKLDHVTSKIINYRSFGICADGKVYISNKVGVSATDEFRKNDVIGCGYYFKERKVFFTKNGNFIKEIVIPDKYYDLYPTVSLKYLNEQIKFNFGKDKNFLFDIDGFCFEKTRINMKQLFSINTTSYEVDYMIKEYLCFSGYFETYKNFENSKCFLNSNNSNSDTNRKIEENNKFMELCKSKSQSKNQNRSNIIQNENELADNSNNLNNLKIEDININNDNNDNEMNSLLLKSIRKFSEEIENSGAINFDNKGLSMIIDRKVIEKENSKRVDDGNNLDKNNDLNDMISIMFFIEEKNCKLIFI